MRGVTILALGVCVALWPLVVSGQSADEVLAEFDDEPTVREVQEATARYNLIDQGQMRGWMTRANTANVLPRVRVDYRLRNDDDIQNDYDRSFTVDEAGNEILTDVDRDQRLNNDDRAEFRLQGDWELRELIFNPDVLRVSNERSDLVELREDLLTTVTSIYFERRRAQVQMMLDPPSDAIERLRRELEIQEMTASIDTLTGGWFSARLSEVGRATY